MNYTLHIISSALLSFGVLCTTAVAQQKSVSKGKLVRIIRNQDDTISEFSQTGDDRVLVKQTLQEQINGARNLLSRTVYRKDADLNLRSAKIYDSRGATLFRVIYGYHKETGLLVAENMYDTRVKRVDANGKEIAIRAVRYTYDAHGNRSRPVIFTALPGKTAEELFQKAPGSVDQDGVTYPFENPFQKPPINPKANNLGQ